ncbi:MAG: DUF6262 family protein [Mycobacterium sp.]
MADQTERLARAAQARHAATLNKATSALHALARTSEPVTFGRVARAAGISRSWLYRHPDLRHQIEELRRSPKPVASKAQSAERASDESNRQKLTLYRQEMARLQAENRSLREQLARRFGAERAAALIDRA